jgi:hypothetical protein
MDRYYWAKHIERLDPETDDKLYVLCTFVTMPIRWLDNYGWRPLTELEKTASASYYRALGQLMGIKDIPATHQEFAAFLDRYEAANFGFDDGGLAVSEATLKLMATGALRLRGRVVRRMPPRRQPLYARQLPNIRSYPDGYQVTELGTFPS